VTIDAMIHGHPSFAAASAQTRERLASSAELWRYADGERVVHGGNPVTHWLLLLKGGLQLYRRNPVTRAQILMLSLEAPGVLGDPEILSGSRWAASARAAGSTELAAIPRDLFQQAVTMDPAFAAGLYRDLALRHALVLQVMQVLSLQKVRDQVLRLLWSQPALADGVVCASPTRLARALGVNARTITRTLQQLEREGAIRRRRDRAELIGAAPPAERLDAPLAGASWRLLRTAA
jgi:CRP-like cAMP-binding protein